MLGGHRVTKIAFNMGDLAYWWPRASILFQKDMAALPSFLAQVYVKHGITDQVLFGDRRPVHVVAIDLARQQGVRNHVFEEGYFRPYWMTLEREGVNARSRMPRSAQWFRRAADSLATKPPVEHFDSPFWRRALHDVAYHAAGSLNPLFFPRYRTHSNISAPVEYAGYLRRFPKLHFARQAQHDNARLRKLVDQRVPFFLLPLQLNSDAQVRDQPVLNSMSALIEKVVHSFAIHAPSTSRLIIKNHPLDIGRVDYELLIRRFGVQFALDGRIEYFETGDLTTMLQHATGTVTLNSTVGCAALEHNCPTLSLGDPIYNLAGLTAQNGLDAFWSTPVKPDAGLFPCFEKVVKHVTQVNGGLYCPRGMAIASEHASGVLTADVSPLQRLMETIQP